MKRSQETPEGDVQGSYEPENAVIFGDFAVGQGSSCGLVSPVFGKNAEEDGFDPRRKKGPWVGGRIEIIPVVNRVQEASQPRLGVVNSKLAEARHDDGGVGHRDKEFAQACCKPGGSNFLAEIDGEEELLSLARQPLVL